MLFVALSGFYLWYYLQNRVKLFKIQVSSEVAKPFSNLVPRLLVFSEYGERACVVRGMKFLNVQRVSINFKLLGKDVVIIFLTYRLGDEKSIKLTVEIIFTCLSLGTHGKHAN